MLRTVTEMEVSPMVQFHSALNDNLYMRCKIVSQLAETCSNKDLQSIYSVLVENIFGLNGQTTWGLKTISRKQQPSEFNLLIYFLGPDGPVFKMIYRLMADNYLRYDFSISCLPSNTRNLFNEGVVPQFYSNKVQIHPHTRTIVGISLNAFEFYFFHFAYFILNPMQHRTTQMGAIGESLYSSLMESYANYFLPLKGQVVPHLPYHVHLNSPSPLYSTSPDIGSLNSYYTSPTALKTAKSPGLLRPTTLMKQNSSSTSLHSPLPPQSHQIETWRSETVAHTLIEFWLNHGISPADARKHPPHHIQPTLGGFSPPQDTFLPSYDHVRMVRVLIKRFHYFINSPDTLSPLDEVKRALVPPFQRRAYRFFCHTFDHWPLDASFRLILEAWLSYIQPWRYVDPAIKDVNDHREKCVDNKWQTFILNNLLFYTAIFNRLLPHFFRVDLTTCKNAFMLFRISKIFYLSNLTTLIRNAEDFLVDPRAPHLSGLSPGGSNLSGGGSYLSDGGPMAKSAAALRQQMADLECPGFAYQSMFSPETRTVVSQLIGHAMQAKATLQAQKAETASRGNDSSMWGALAGLFSPQPSNPEGEDYIAEDCHATCEYLEQSMIYLRVIYGDAPQLELPGDLSVRPVTPLSHSQQLEQPEQMMTAEGPVLTPRGRWQLINRQCRTNPVYQGNPDLTLIRSDESAVVVRMLHHLCSTLNSKYGTEMQDLYLQRNLRGQMARQILEPPTIYYEQKEAGRQQVVLPPRLCLRPLARYCNLAYLAVYYVLAYAILNKGIFPTTLVLLFFAFGIVVFKALLEPWFGHPPPSS